MWRNTWEGLQQGGQWHVAAAGLQLNHPCGLSFTGDCAADHGRLAIADCYNNRVGVCALPSAQLSADAHVSWSSCPLFHPTGVCWSRDSSSIAVADFDTGRVLWLRGDTLEVEGQAASDAGQGKRSWVYDVEYVGEGGGGGLWVATDCVSSRVLLLHRDVRVRDGCAVACSADMMVSPPQ